MQINWEINNAQVKTTAVNGLAEIVQSCWWRCSASDTVINFDGRPKTVTAQMTGEVVFDDPNPLNFIQFGQLNQATVLSWVFDKFNSGIKEQIEQAVLDELNSLKNPPILDRPIPL